MGCLANAIGTGQLMVAEGESFPDPTLIGGTDHGSDETPVDLPLWFSALVDPRTWDEPSEIVSSETYSRLFWRVSVARWPLESRQRWGDRANQLQDAGLAWNEAERVAFEELMEERQVRRAAR